VGDVIHHLVGVVAVRVGLIHRRTQVADDAQPETNPPEKESEEYFPSPSGAPAGHPSVDCQKSAALRAGLGCS